MKKEQPNPDIHWLYEASVQNVDTDLDFAKRIYKKHRGKTPTLLREDFCGTAKLACRWVQRNAANEAWGLDLHQPTLDWGIKYNVAELTEKQRKRLHLVCENVLEPPAAKVDMVLALNFSFCVFKERSLLRQYFETVARSLKKKGIFVLDIYGGTESVAAKSDDIRIISGFTTPEGLEIPDFEYEWEQAEYNPINHHTLCHIHFNVPGYGKIRKAFTYDWRLWTLAEIQELLLESGFSKAEVYLHGFDEKGESDETFRLRTTYENTQGWIAYVAGIR